MALNLVNPALQYSQPDQIDPMSGLAVSIPDVIKFFKNPAARGKQFAADAAKAIQPSIADVSGELGTPQFSEGQTMLPGPVQASVPDFQYTPGQDNTSVSFQSPTVNLPKFVQPKFSDVSEGPMGTPKPINIGETKLGKLLHIIKAATEGGLAGSSQDTFGGGVQAALAQPYQNAFRKLQLQSAAIQNQQQQEAMASAPLQRAAQIIALRRAPYIEGPAGVFDVRTGKIAPGTERPDPNQTPEQRVLEANTRIQQGVGTEADKATVKAWNDMLQSKQDVKPDSAAVAKQDFQSTMAQLASEGGITPDAMTSLPKLTAAINRSRTLSPAQKQKALAYVASTPTPASQGSMANLRLEGLGQTRGMSAVLDTQTGIVGPATWEQINENPGRYQSPQFGLTGERQKFLQQYENPAGRASINRQAINNIMQHAGDLADLNGQYRRTNVKLINTPLNKIAAQFGSEAYTKFATTTSVLKDELGLYFAGGYAPQGDQIKRWNEILADNAPPSAVEAFAKEVIHLGLRRATTFNDQFKKTMGYDDPNMIIPEAASAAQKLGLGNEVKRFGSGGQYGNDLYQGRPQPKQSPQPSGNYAPGFSPL